MNKEIKILIAGAALLLTQEACSAFTYKDITPTPSQEKSISTLVPADTNPTENVFLQTPALEIIEITATPTPTEVLNLDNKNSNWDANTMPKGLTRDGLYAYYAAEKAKNLPVGQNRAIDTIDKLLSDGNGDIFAKDVDGSAMKADEILANETNFGRAILTKLGYAPDDTMAHGFGRQIVINSFGISADGKDVFTRVTFPQDVNGVTRENQAESRPCAVYDQTKEDHEYFDKSGVMHLPNESTIHLVVRIGDNYLQDQDINQFGVKNAKGEQKIISWAWIDDGSQPGESAGLDKPEDPARIAWAAKLLKGCGVSTTKVQPAKVAPAPINTSVPATSQPGQTPEGPTNVPPKKTLVPPPTQTSVAPSATPELPTAVPTNPGRVSIATATEGPAPTHAQPTTQATSMPIPK